jgi:alpha-glucoside transport system permease protein
MTVSMKRIVFGVLLNLVVIVLLALWVVPTLGLFVTSFRTPQAVAHSGWWRFLSGQIKGAGLTFHNYQQVILKQGIGRGFLNSLIISIPAVLFPVIIGGLAAFAFSWMRFRGRLVLFALLVGLLVVPLQMTFIPVLKIYNVTRLTSTFPAMWLAHTAYALPLATFLLHNFMTQLPKAMIDSAQIDGASTFGVFSKIILPLSFSAVASLIIFQFVWVWNDMLIALTYLGGAPNVSPVTVDVATLVGQRGNGWEVLTAAAFVSMILPMVVFFSLQRYFARGLLAGSVKE